MWPYKAGGGSEKSKVLDRGGAAAPRETGVGTRGWTPTVLSISLGPRNARPHALTDHGPLAAARVRLALDHGDRDAAFRRRRQRRRRDRVVARLQRRGELDEDVARQRAGGKLLLTALKSLS